MVKTSSRKKDFLKTRQPLIMYSGFAADGMCLPSGGGLLVYASHATPLLTRTESVRKLRKIDKIELKTVFSITIEILIWSLNERFFFRIFNAIIF